MLTFGVASASFLAICTIRKLADNESYIFPKAAEILKNNMYVDDLLTGANSIDEVRSIRNEIISLLSRDGFSIRQWATRVIHDLSNNTLHAYYAFEKNRSMKILGILWNIRDDKLHYSVQSVKTIGIVKKEKILSEIAKIYDRMGLMGPVIPYVKQLLQNL